MVHAVLYCSVALDVVPLGSGFPACLDAGEVYIRIRPLRWEGELACLMQGSRVLSLLRPNSSARLLMASMERVPPVVWCGFLYKMEQ